MLGRGNGARVGGIAAACLTFSSVLKRINALVVVQVEVSAERRRQADNWLLRCCHQGSAGRVSSLHHQPQCQPAHGPMAMRRVRQSGIQVACVVHVSHGAVVSPCRTAHTSLQAQSPQPCLRCSRWAESGCSSGNGFKLSVKLRPNTVYVFIVVGMDIAPTLRFGVTWATAAVAPLAAPQGAWSNARTIQGLPFTSPAFNVSNSLAPRQQLPSANTHQPETNPHALLASLSKPSQWPTSSSFRPSGLLQEHCAHRLQRLGGQHAI